MSNETKQAKYASKRETKKIGFDLYLDDAVEKRIFEKLKNEPRGEAKRIFVEVMSKHYGVNKDA